MTALASRCNYAFGRFLLQPSERRLLAGSEPASIGARAFDVLVALVERAGRLVTKDELLEVVWPNLCVEENNLQAQVSSLRKILGAESIATVQGRGYRFAWLPQRVEEPNTSEGARHNLAQQLTSFIGREKEMAEVNALLARMRVLTLTGCGGCGKTRLCVQVAAALVDQFPDGVWFVELASLSADGLLPQTVAAALGIREEPGSTVMAALIAHLRSKQLLLILDNCEHLRDACAALSETVARSCSGVKILASSREPLGFAGEQTYRVPSLSLPDEKPATGSQMLLRYEAIALFVDRACSIDSHFRLTDRNASVLASICRRLDGIPLAIELAAARVRTLSVEEIDCMLGQRFRLLTMGSRTALPRHQTLRSLIDWSYDLLRDPEKLLLQRLSVFCGGWTLAAAEHVCADFDGQPILDLLASLSNKSLVVADQNDGRSRYRLLETIRQYARERLVENGHDQAIDAKHRDYFLSVAEEAEPKLRGAEQADCLRRLEEDHENLRAALEWSLAGPGSLEGLRICGALRQFWWTRGHLSEGREWCARVLRKPGAEERTPERAKALNAAGGMASIQGDYKDAKARFDESLSIRRQLGDRRGIAASLNNLGNVACDLGEFASAQALHEECLKIRRELNDQRGIANSLNNLGNVACVQGDLVFARTLHTESLAIARDLGDPGSIAYSLHNLGDVAGELSDFASAKALYEESLAIQRELGDRHGIVYSLERLAAVVAAFGGPRRAANIWGAAGRFREEIGSPLPPSERPRFDRCVAPARTALGNDADFDCAWQQGRELTLEQAIDFALMEPVTERGEYRGPRLAA